MGRVSANVHLSFLQGAADQSWQEKEWKMWGRYNKGEWKRMGTKSWIWWLLQSQRTVIDVLCSTSKTGGAVCSPGEVLWERHTGCRISAIHPMGMDMAVHRNSVSSHSSPGGTELVIAMIFQFHSLCWGNSVCSQAETHVFLVCAGTLPWDPASLSHLHHGIHTPLWLWWQHIWQQVYLLQCVPVSIGVKPFL